MITVYALKKKLNGVNCSQSNDFEYWDISVSNYIWRQHPFVSSVILAISEAEYLTSLETKVLPEMVKHRRFEKNGYFNLRSIKQWRIRPIFPVQETRRRTKFQAFQYRWTDMISL